MRSIEQMIEELQVAKGLKPADLVLLNARLVMLHTEEIMEGCLYIKNGRIAAIRHEHSLLAIGQYDCEGRFVLPGFIDAHVSIEPTLLTPETLSEVIVPQGTTTLLAHGLEMDTVTGLSGMDALLQSVPNETLHYNLWRQVPPEELKTFWPEAAGHERAEKEVVRKLAQSYSVRMGEVLSSEALDLSETHLNEVLMAQSLGKIVNGKAAGLKWDELNVCACAGLADDHECVEYDELLMRLRLGMGVLIRESSAERSLDALITGLLRERLPYDGIMFCTNGKHVYDIHREGHLNYMVNRAVQLGVPPMKAIKMATLNTAKHFRLDHLIGSITPGKWADLILVEELERIRPEVVFYRGTIAAQQGKLIAPVARPVYPERLRQTVRLGADFSAEQFKVLSGETAAVKVRVIHLYPNQIVNFGSVETLQPANGEIRADAARDILKLAVVERFGRTGDVGVAFVKGFGIQDGALACSVAHDHHNIVVVGTNDKDMELAVRTIEMHQGGLVAVSSGVIQAVLPLPIGGLVTDLGAEEVIGRMEHLNDAVRAMGCRLPAPFMTLSFISLPTVPELGMTDKGLVDVKSHSIIPVLI
ncbi:adenine deaminase [Paenibacillus rigui]|uniref:Adenine deaminase n=1 Tax=Paenibacillus rigui TaxID=554312 RepID=A0A229UWE0_9BACL|nr:adenine deaminase C-terminal domain-containing protein [Paenibacillus rigui]OXM87772.1 adenine deaminase [Paenibacillus rigui]